MSEEQQRDEGILPGQIPLLEKIKWMTITRVNSIEHAHFSDIPTLRQIARRNIPSINAARLTTPSRSLKRESAADNHKGGSIQVHGVQNN